MKKELKNLLLALYLYFHRNERSKFYFKKLWKIGFKKNLLTKKQKQEIDKFYQHNYGKRISHKEHNLILNYNQQFDAKYIPTKIFLQFVDSVNSHKLSIFQDKNFLYTIAKLAEVKIPKRYYYSLNNLLFDSNNNIISKQNFYKQIANIGEVFIKPTVLSGCGKGCNIINIINGIETNTSVKIENFINDNYKTDFVIQEKICCHESISKFHPKSVNTFIVFTYIWKNEIKTLASILKIGTNGSILDFSSENKEGLSIAVDKNGYLADAAFCFENGQKYFQHPNTKLIFKNYKIDLFPKVLDTAIKLHKVIPWLGICKWDITIDKEGIPVVIETERPISSLFLQIATGKSMFEENTNEILSFLKSNKSFKY